MFTFADDTKCFMKIVSELDIQKFQENLSSVSEWSNNTVNNLAFSIPKYVFLHYKKKFNSVYSLALTAARALVFIFLIIYHGDCTFRTLPLKLINHLDYFIVYSKMSIV